MNPQSDHSAGRTSGGSLSPQERSASQRTVSSRMRRLVVLCGGTSAEREVSLESGRNVTQMLRGRGHHVRVIDPAEESLEQTMPTEAVDVVVPMLHGTGAEDGTLQLLLQRLQIPYLGSSADASALTFDKDATRQRLQQDSLPVPPGTLLTAVTWQQNNRLPEDAPPLPVVVKPVCQGSSVGVSIVRTTDQLPAAVDLAFRYDNRVLIEQFIPGREVTVTVIDGKAFPAIEIVPGRDWYDYEAKYADEATRYIPDPPGIPPGLDQLALRACQVCAVSAICRVDLRIDPDNHPWLLEINTIPGMTSHSLVPMSIRAAGAAVVEVLEGCIEQLL
ncbi:MAG: D-alanine--D-alanine ligase [Planctomycetaceae bacterium]|nr:D-alanine--D-alanine ligase [Planctomycetaceae bacterium]